MFCTILLVNGNLSHTEINSNDRKHLTLEYVQVLQANTITIRVGSTYLTQVESTLYSVRDGGTPLLELPISPHVWTKRSRNPTPSHSWWC